MNNFWEWIQTEKYKGLIDLKGIDEDKLGPVAKHGRFYHKYKNGQPCTGIKITGSSNLIDKLKTSTKAGYYSLLFNNKNILIIFKNRIFELPRKTLKRSPQFKQAVSYLKKHKIPEFYFNEIEDTLW